MEPEIVADYACEIGESPVWHPLEKRLYWVDIPTGRMFWFDPATGEHEQCYQGVPMGGLTIQEDGALLLFMDKGAVAVWRQGELSYVIDEIPREHENRFNDVIADPAGRVFCGTVPADGQFSRRVGGFYRLDTDGSITLLQDRIGCSNGMGFTQDRKGMYYVDSEDLRIYLFDYDVETGNLSNQRVFVQAPEDGTEPDGMTVDAEGYVWSAQWDASSLIRYTPKGVEERRIQFPAKKVASVTFGGEDYADIYVATAGGNNKAEEGPGAGALFRLKPGIKGMPEFFSRVGL